MTPGIAVVLEQVPSDTKDIQAKMIEVPKKPYVTLAERPETLDQFPKDLRAMVISFGLDG